MELEEFAQANAPAEGGDTFQLESDKMLDVRVDGQVLAKTGSMVAYTGDLSFKGKSSAEGGITGWIKEKATSEGTPVMQAEGQGHVYLADQGKKIQVIELDAGEEISVNGEDVLAFEADVDYEIRTIDSIAGISAGGMTNVFLEGPGSVAISTHGDPIVLTPPVRTDPQATVAWSGTASPGHHADRSLADMVGQTSDETYQLDFKGTEGFVVVQPFEETSPVQ
jgi:uncharacterized protein (AIM24 family)